MRTREYKTFNGLTGVLGLCLAAVLCVTGQQAMAQLPDVSDQYTIQVIDLPADTIPYLTRVNEAGLVVMQYASAMSPGNIAILEKGEWTVISPPGSVYCAGSNPSASGRVALTYDYAADPAVWHATMYHQGTYIPVPDNPDHQFWINSISDHGLMVGAASLPEDPYSVGHGLLLNTRLSLFQIFDPPGSVWTSPLGINNAGLVVGAYIDIDWNYCGFLYDGENFMDIKVPGAMWTVPVSINNSGEIGGGYTDSLGNWRGFLLRKGEFEDFTVASFFTYGVDGINDRGQLSGEFQDWDGSWHVYIATPVRGGTRAGK